MKDEYIIVFPKKKPKTLGDILNWHIKLFDNCLKYELKKKIIEEIIKRIREIINGTLPLLKKDGYKEGAKIKLIKLNEILDKYKEDLKVTKEIIRGLHKTNESIIGTITKRNLGEERLKELYEEYKDKHPNLLHGDGWMIEYLIAKEHWDKGEAVFLTFGTFMDPAKWDAIIFSYPLNTPIKFNLDYKKLKKKRIN